MTTEEPPGGAPLGRRHAARKRTDRIHLLIVDQHALLRAGVRTLLESDGGVEVVAEAETIDEAVDMIRDSSPDVVLMDIDEPTPDSVEDMRRLCDEMPAEGALVVLARNETDEGVYQAVVGGAAGHVGENAQPEELVDTIKQAAQGEDPISATLVERPEVGRRVLEAYALMAARGPVRRPPKLTERELSILNLAAQGQTNQQIGRSLGVSEHTVKSAISLILARLGLRHRTEAVVYALRNGWITTPPLVERAPDEPLGNRFARPGF